MGGEGSGGEEERGAAPGHTWLGFGRGQGECLDRHQGAIFTQQDRHQWAIFTQQRFLPWEP